MLQYISIMFEPGTESGITMKMMATGANLTCVESRDPVITVPSYTYSGTPLTILGSESYSPEGKCAKDYITPRMIVCMT